LVKDDPYLDKCRQQAEQAVNWGDSAGWSNEDFENLSDKIAAKTQVKLSVSTLKRIWGKVKYKSSPTAATLNALARFLDYENWRDFMQKNTVAAPEQLKSFSIQPVAEKIAMPEKPANSRPSFKRVFVTVVVLVALATISLGLITMFKAKKITPHGNEPAVTFTSRKTTEDLPNSVVFDYDASAYHSNDVMIQQNWDVNRRQKVPGDSKVATSIYYYPGYFNAKLVVNGEIKKEHHVFIKTRGWKGIVVQKPVPVYLSAADVTGNGSMHITATTMRAKTGLTVFNDVWSYFANVREFPGLDSSDFTFETTLRNMATVEQSLCRNIKVSLLTTQSAIIVPLSDKGCIADLGLLTGYDWIEGKNHDLSAFGCDFTSFQHLAISLHNQHLIVSLNSKQILDVALPGNEGNIVGIRYEFEGPGQVKDVRLASKDKVVYEERF